MNRNIMVMKMKNTMTVIATLLVICLLQGCSKDSNADLRDLLATVPSDAGIVGSIDVKEMAQNAGIKVKDGKMEFPAEMLDAVSKITDTRIKDALMLVSDGNSGVEISSVVAFTQGYYNYVTGLLNDTEAFKKAVENEMNGAGFTTENDVDVCRNVAVTGNQFWIADVPSAVEPNIIKGFTVLSEKQSFLSNEYAGKLLEMDHDMEFIADINGLFSRMQGGMRNMAGLRIAMGALFSDAAFLTIDGDFEKGEFEMVMKVFDSKMKQAKYLLPSEKISKKTLESVGGAGSVVVAAAIPQELIGKFSQLGSGFGGSIDTYLSPLKCIDGTVAFVASRFEGPAKAVNGIIETNGSSSVSLNGILSAAGMSSRIDGKNILVSTGNSPEGRLLTKDVATEFKDAMLAVAIDPETIGEKESSLKGRISKVYILLKPENGSVELEIKVISTNPKENFLKTLCTR